MSNEADPPIRKCSAVPFVLKTDSMGSLQWNQKYIGNIVLGRVNSIVETSDGGFVAVGSSDVEGTNVFLWKVDAESGLAWTDSTADTVTLYRGATDAWWNYVRLQIWKID